jgi:peptide-methionine (S)-S-oxide reductase
MFGFKKVEMVTAQTALPGRESPMAVYEQHAVNGRSFKPPFPDGLQEIVLGMGCFWGAERLFWQTHGVWVTAVGYAGGYTPNPTYREVCSGQTGHTEVVRVVFDPQKVSLQALLAKFWEGHDPTQGMRQGNDVGTQYRSLIGAVDASMMDQVLASRAAYQQALDVAGGGHITTEIVALDHFYLAERDHQQYLAKVPNGYCGLKGTGVSCPLPAASLP